MILQRNWIVITHQLLFSSKIIRELEIIIKKKVIATREKPRHLKTQKLLEQQSNSILQHHNSKLKLNCELNYHDQNSIDNIIPKSDLTDKMKTQFLPSSSRVGTAIWMHYMDANQTDGEKAWWQLHKNTAINIEQVLEATPPHKAAAIQPPTTHHKNYQNQMNQTCGTQLER